MKAFNTPYYVFATSGIVQTARYKIEEGQPFFAPDTHLFKHDLKLLNPKAGVKLGTSDKANLPIPWNQPALVPQITSSLQEDKPHFRNY